MITKIENDRLALVEAAAEAGQLCLMECRRNPGGERVVLLCHAHDVGHEVSFMPIAEIISSEDPFAGYIPPPEERGTDA